MWKLVYLTDLFIWWWLIISIVTGKFYNIFFKLFQNSDIFYVLVIYAKNDKNVHNINRFSMEQYFFNILDNRKNAKYKIYTYVENRGRGGIFIKTVQLTSTIEGLFIKYTIIFKVRFQSIKVFLSVQMEIKMSCKLDGLRKSYN